MKKILSVMLLLTICAVTLCGCGLNEKPVSLGSSMEIPEDGIIPASVFERLQKENKVMTFFGQNGDSYYEWTVFGSDVETPQDTNMKLEVTNDRDGRIDFALCTENEFAFSAVLSLRSSCLWTADNATVYYYDGDAANPITSASVTGTKMSVLNFSLTKPGHYSVIEEKFDGFEEQAVLIAEAGKGEDEKSETQSEIDSYLLASDSAVQVISDGKQIGMEEYLENQVTVGETAEEDMFLSDADDGGRVLSDGKQTGQDKYLTDPVPAGKPMPVEPENQEIDEGHDGTCTLSIECSTILNNLDDLNTDKLDAVPTNGVIFPKQTVIFYEGESVYDVLQRVCSENGIHMEASWTPIYNSAYVEGIHNLYEFDCGNGSGWMYRVNGWYPNYGCSRYQLAQGDRVEWRYTCDLGADIGGAYAIGE